MFRRDGAKVVHNTNTSAYEMLVLKREFAKEISNLQEQINVLTEHLNERQDGNRDQTTTE